MDSHDIAEVRSQQREDSAEAASSQSRDDSFADFGDSGSDSLRLTREGCRGYNYHWDNLRF
jgi:hypothetical protein